MKALEITERIARRIREDCARRVEAEALNAHDVWTREALYRAAEMLRRCDEAASEATILVFRNAGRRLRDR